MKGVAQKEKGAPKDVLEIVDDLPLPVVEGDFDVVVKVHAVATNPIDNIILAVGRFIQKEGHSNDRRTVGWDASGVVTKAGAKALFKEGDEVFFAGELTREGAFAEQVVVDSRIAGAKPKTISHQEAAALPLCTLTAWEGIEDRMNIPADPKVNANKSILFIGGAGGVGSIGIQLAKHVFGFGTIVATASREETIAYCKELGATHVINHREKLAPQLKEIGVPEVDVLYCAAMAEKSFAEWTTIIAPFGKCVLINGDQGETSLGGFKIKSITIANEMMYARAYHGVDVERQGEILNKTAQLIDNKTIVTNAKTKFEGWQGVIDALVLQASGKAIGKSVIKIV